MADERLVRKTNGNSTTNYWFNYMQVPMLLKSVAEDPEEDFIFKMTSSFNLYNKREKFSTMFNSSVANLMHYLLDKTMIFRANLGR